MPFTGVAIAAVLATRGKSKALVAEVRSRMALAFGSVVPIPTCAKVIALIKRAKNRINIFFILSI